MKFSNTIKTVLKIYQKYVKNSVWFGTGRVSVVFQLFDFQLSMLLEVHNNNVLLPQSRANIQPDMSGCWRFGKRTIKQAQIHTGFHCFTD